MCLDNNEAGPVVFIAGPTACGKTATAVRLAELIGGEVVSADSMQIYRHMDIGTAKPTPEETRGIPHHLISELDPDEPFSAAVFKQMAERRVAEILSRGAAPIIAGGTGFYINALLYGTEFPDTFADHEFRKELRDYAAEYGNAALHERLRAVDPEAAAAIHENNVKRVIRAIEFFEQTGIKISRHNEAEKKKAPAYKHLFIVLSKEREKLYKGIDARVDAMITAGLVGEVRALASMGYGPELVSMNGLGYKEIHRYISGEWTLETAVDEIKKGTRRFAKRQLTWFKNIENAVWLDADEYPPDSAAEYIRELLIKKHDRIIC